MEDPNIVAKPYRVRWKVEGEQQLRWFKSWPAALAFGRELVDSGDAPKAVVEDDLTGETVRVE